MRALSLLLLLAAACLAAGEGSREGVFVGYKEVGVDGGGGGGDAAAGDAAARGGLGAGDGSLNAGGKAGGGGDDAAEATRQAQAQVADAAALAALATEVGRTVLLHTQFGPIRVKMLEKLAPRTTGLVWELAKKRGCSTCAFYRNEGRPHDGGQGPPYSLLQGRLPELAETPPREGNIEVKMGHVCFIPETRDFFIAYGDHPEWGTSHTVWGLVDDWFATDLTIAQHYLVTTHPEFGTKMRMLRAEVPIRITVEGDATYSGLLGPLH